MGIRNRKAKASYTIEAAIILPIVLFIILGAVRLGVTLHQEVKEEACHYERLEELDAVKEVKKLKKLEILGGES